MSEEAEQNGAAAGPRPDDGGPRNLRDHLMPSTFEERGASVPFTTPALAHARVRQGARKELELRLGNLSGGQGTYVIPWNGISEMVTLTAHDRYLVEEVKQRKAVDPSGVRLAALAVAETGLAGQDVMDAAATPLKADEEAEALHQVLLILRLVREFNAGDATQMIQRVKTADGQEQTRVDLQAIGAKLGLAESQLDARIAAVGRVTYSLAFDTSPEHGRLRMLYHRLLDFRDSVGRWAEGRVGETEAQALFTATVAKHTIVSATETVTRYDGLMVRPTALLAQSEGPLTEVTRLVSRTAWLVDGWEPIVEAWFMCKDDSERIDYLFDILPVLPWVPRDEVSSDAEKNKQDNLVQSSRRWVRMNIDWRTGEADFDLVRRIESWRAQTR